MAFLRMGCGNWFGVYVDWSHQGVVVKIVFVDYEWNVNYAVMVYVDACITIIEVAASVLAPNVYGIIVS